MHLILKPLARQLVTACPDTHLCCEWSSCGTNTIFPCHFSASRHCCFLQLLQVVLDNLALDFSLFFDLGAPFPFFGFTDPKSGFFYLNFCSTLMTYWYAMLSKQMFRNSISSWMYFCRQPQYLSIKCYFKSLIPNFVHRVSKILVNSGTSWSLPCRNMVHFMYWS